MGERSKAFRKAGKFMTNEEIIQYYDYLIRLATSKSNSQTDAEDLVGDTMLVMSALAKTKSGHLVERTHDY